MKAFKIVFMKLIMKVHALLLVVSPSLFLAPASAWTQFALRRGFQGIDFDPSGAVAPDAQITLLALALNQSIHIKAAVAGHFDFNNLTACQCHLTKSALEFATQKLEPIRVPIGVVSHNPSAKIKHWKAGVLGK